MGRTFHCDDKLKFMFVENKLFHSLPSWFFQSQSQYSSHRCTQTGIPADQRKSVCERESGWKRVASERIVILWGRAFAPLFQHLHSKAAKPEVLSCKQQQQQQHSPHERYESKRQYRTKRELYRHCAHAHPFISHTLSFSISHQDMVKLITHSCWSFEYNFFSTPTHARTRTHPR